MASYSHLSPPLDSVEEAALQNLGLDRQATATRRGHFESGQHLATVPSTSRLRTYTRSASPVACQIDFASPQSLRLYEQPEGARLAWLRTPWSRTVLREVVTSAPSVVLWPLLVFTICVGLGVWGVLAATQDYKDVQRGVAAELAADAARHIELQLAQAFSPTVALEIVIQQDPRFPVVQAQFGWVAARLLSRIAPGTISSVQLAPGGVVQAVYPLQGNAQALGHDLLADASRRDDSLKAMRLRNLTVAGPYALLQGGLGVIMRFPVYIANSSADEAFGANVSTFPCPEGLCWDPDTRTRFWGFAQGVARLDGLLQGVDARMQRLSQHGPWRLTRLLGPDPGNETLLAASAASACGRPDACVQVDAQLPNTVWRLYLGKAGGWEPGWAQGMLALVVAGSFVLSALLLGLLVNRQRHCALLRAMFPAKVLRPLQQGKNFSEEFDSVSIVFSDVCGFTSLASALRPIEVADMLNTLYCAFDEAVERNGCYKVETIGDAFMAVGGCPVAEPPEAAAERVAHMAADMLAAAAAHGSYRGHALRIRVGIASGPAAAAVIGRKMPRYCLFGDTVNFASRLESTSESMRVQVSAGTAELLRRCASAERFRLTPRGLVALKGKGYQETFWLERDPVGPPPPSRDPATVLIPVGVSGFDTPVAHSAPVSTLDAAASSLALARAHAATDAGPAGARGGAASATEGRAAAGASAHAPQTYSSEFQWGVQGLARGAGASMDSMSTLSVANSYRRSREAARVGSAFESAGSTGAGPALQRGAPPPGVAPYPQPSLDAARATLGGGDRDRDRDRDRDTPISRVSHRTLLQVLMAFPKWASGQVDRSASGLSNNPSGSGHGTVATAGAPVVPTGAAHGPGPSAGAAPAKKEANPGPVVGSPQAVWGPASPAMSNSPLLSPRPGQAAGLGQAPSGLAPLLSGSTQSLLHALPGRGPSASSSRDNTSGANVIITAALGTAGAASRDVSGRHAPNGVDTSAAVAVTVTDLVAGPHAIVAASGGVSAGAAAAPPAGGPREDAGRSGNGRDGPTAHAHATATATATATVTSGSSAIAQPRPDRPEAASLPPQTPHATSIPEADPVAEEPAAGVVTAAVLLEAAAAEAAAPGPARGFTARESAPQLSAGQGDVELSLLMAAPAVGGAGERKGELAVVIATRLSAVSSAGAAPPAVAGTRPGTEAAAPATPQEA